MALGNSMGIGIPMVRLGLGGGGGAVTEPEFVIQVKTDNEGDSNDNQFKLPWNGTYDVDWGDGTSDSGVTNTQTHTYSSAGNYDIKITPVSGAVRIEFDNGGDRKKLLDIKNWGSCEWTTMHRAFKGCEKLEGLSAMDVPNFTNCTDTSNMFENSSNFSGNGAMNSWDMSNITNTRAMFKSTSFNSPIGNWDMSNVTVLTSRYSGMFEMSLFNQDVSSWDVSNVTNMTDLFARCPFNQPINDWDVSSVTTFGTGGNVSGTFGPDFNQPLDRWDVSNVTEMKGMFYGATSFNQDISGWDISNVTNMSLMFHGCRSFNQDLSVWDVSNVTYMSGNFQGGMFGSCYSFNFEYIANWDVSNVTSISRMFMGNIVGYLPVDNWVLKNGVALSDLFSGCKNLTTLNLSNWNIAPSSVNGMFSNCDSLETLDLSGFDLSNVTNMSSMFANCYNLETIGNFVWDLSNNTTMSRLFQNCNKLELDPSNCTVTSNTTNFSETFANCKKFNGDISSWDLSGAVSVSRMFYYATSFNQNIGGLDVSSVTNMELMFFGATAFNGDISSWDVSNVTNMKEMFARAPSFNQPLNSWNTGNVTNMYRTFQYAYAFDQSLSNWNVEKVTDFREFMRGALLSTANYNSTLIGWATQTLKPNEQIEFGLSSFSNAALASRNSIISNYGWTITDSGEVNEFATLPTGAFVYSAKTTGTYTIPTKSGETYNYDVSTSDGQTFTGATGNTTITFPSAGTYDIAITGNFARPYFRDDQALDSVKQWSNTPLTSLEESFESCGGFRNLATNAPDLSICTSMRKTFYRAADNYKNAGRSRYVNSLNNWNTSNITNMYQTFDSTKLNYANLGSWNTSNVTTMNRTFAGAGGFNNGGIDNLNNWDVSKVADFEYMFASCDSLKQYIGGWQFGVPTEFDNMFNNTDSLDSSWGLANWNTANVTNINNIFSNASYVDITSWNINNVTNFGSIAPQPNLTISQYENLLVSWAAQTPQSNRSFNAGASRIVPGSAGETAKNTLINTYNWTITDGGNITNFTQPYVYSINTNNPGEGTNSQYTLPQGIDSYYTATFSDGQQFTNTYGGDVVTFAAPGVYDVSIVGSFTLGQSLYQNDPEYRKIVEIKAWGNMIIKSFYRTFYRCSDLQKVTSTSSPNIDSSLTSCWELFEGCGLTDINFARQWDVSNVTDMSSMFKGLIVRRGVGASIDLSGWDVSSAVNMEYMFAGNTFGVAKRSTNLSNWNMPNLTNIKAMFDGNRYLAELNITGWSTPSLVDMRYLCSNNTNLTTIAGIEYLNTSNVTNMYEAFNNTTKLNISLATFGMSNVTDLRNIFRGTNAMSVANYDATLISWSNQVLKPNEQTNFGTAKYTLGGAAEAARNTIINTYGWTITDGGGI